MLTSLHIENIAVIEKAGIDLNAGLNVLTGETGAGKSMVIDAINAALGERISRDVVRTGSDQARVTAVFSGISARICAQLEELGYPVDEDGALLIQRVISAEGKGQCRINGQPATVAMLRSIGRMLVNIHGQHENQALLSPEKHVEYLEALGGVLPVRERFASAYKQYTDIQRQLEQLSMDESDKARRMDMLRYQIEEIEKASLRVGEEEELRATRTLYRNAEKIAVALLAAREKLSGGEESDGALSLLYEASGELQAAGRYVEDIAKISERVESLLYELEECAGDLRDFESSLDFEPGALEQVEERLDHIHRITKKYGGSEEAALTYLNNAIAELEGYETADMRIAKLQTALRTALEDAVIQAQKLTKAREKAAEDFERQVGEQLTFLDMPGVRLRVHLEPTALGSHGLELVEFQISANAGEEPRSIAKIASGGELSRIMLAIKAVMANADDIDTLVFDEIDTGISGRAAHKVGIKLRETASSRQVLCVTHLAQIAAQAHHHFLIQKSVRDGRTYTEVTALSEQGRLNELARIIGGEPTAVTLEAAKEMLARVE